jgi:C4-dicarboxylate transporter, DctM subunit
MQAATGNESDMTTPETLRVELRVEEGGLLTNDLRAHGRLLDQLEQLLGNISGVLSVASVIGMLAIAGITMVDVLIRWLVTASIPALNEVVELVFAVAITACIPGGLSQRVNPKIDVFSRILSRRHAGWLEVAGHVSLAFFYGALSWRIFIFAQDLAEQGRTTVILGWPKAPFIYAVALLLAFGTFLQGVITINTARSTFALHANRTKYSALAGYLMLAVLTISLIVAAIFCPNFSALSLAAQAHVGITVVLVFVMMWIMTLASLPIAATMALVGTVSSALFIGWTPSLSAAATEATGFLTNSQVATLPLFLMMGSFAATANISEDVYRLAHVLFGRFRGGLALATIGGCASFGSLTGNSMATAAIIGKVSLPEMRARGYSPAFATGCCAAGGTLGALLPPASGPLILFALLSEASVGQLFVAALIPGLLAVTLYFITVLLYVRISPLSAPARGESRETTAGELWLALKNCGPAALLFGSVLGGIYSGVFTATEAAAVGAFEAFLIALFRGKLRSNAFLRVMGETTAATAMIYGLIFGAQIFSFFVGISALTESASALLAHLDWSPTAIIALILFIYLVLGSLMDSFAVMVITVPVITPLVIGMGYDMLWWGVVNLCVVETGLIHPPLGLNVFVLKGMQPDVPLRTIYKGVFPFVLADLVKLVLLVAFPSITLWLVSNL